MYCKNKCQKFKAENLSMSIRYLRGQKYCKTCCIFINFEDVRCPCCHNKLRIKPKNKQIFSQTFPISRVP